MTKSIAKKSTTGSLPPAVPLAITPTFSPWTHKPDDSYIYQLSLVLATATVSFVTYLVYTRYQVPHCVKHGRFGIVVVAVDLVLTSVTRRHNTTLWSQDRLQ